MSHTIDLLKNWKTALNSQIGDTCEEIEKRRNQNSEAVIVRDDLSALIEYLSSNDVLAPVKLAIERALSWVPYTRKPVIIAPRDGRTVAARSPRPLKLWPRFLRRGTHD